MQVTIITGASRGLGTAIAEDRETRSGIVFTISSEDVDFKNYNKVKSFISQLLTYCTDITQLNLILCAAQIGTSNEIDLRNIDKLYRINVIGNLAVIQAAIEVECKLRIVWFAGGGAAFPYPEFFGYSLSKVAVVRAVENLSKILSEGSSIIALAPGAVQTDMLKTVEESGAEIRTRTDISEPVNFVRKFITDEFDSLSLNGMFLHVRDVIPDHTPIEGKKDLFKLRRIE